MNKLIDTALGIHPRALSIGARRLETLAANMANADTPRYKARDVDFRSALSEALTDRAARPAGSLRTTDAGHLPAGSDTTPELLYRVPNEPSLDGNTVDAQMEQAAFSEAAVRYQASLDFLAGRIEGLRKALRGE
ncbi:MAG: flagellar basal body rod protein FlgB [Gammaproteobacteria bacterium]|nr:flagellar basal body rod protein FlgB [Gammaproteobacteria bacterium]